MAGLRSELASEFGEAAVALVALLQLLQRLGYLGGEVAARTLPVALGK